MSFSFIANPSGQSLNDASFATSALDQPMSLGATFFDQAGGGILESFGLGTAIREGRLPEEAPTTKELVITPPEGGEPVRVPDTPQMRRRITAFESVNPEQSLQSRQETQQEFQQRQDEAGSLSEDAYKASPYFRKDVPWQNGMTTARAQALAEMDDRRKVREFYASKRPITSFFGNLGGQALDPINYIPVFGEAVAAANVARFGRVAGRALTSSLDAAANTAIAGLATAPIRERLGDDVSWQNTISQIAMAAVIGGAFGAVAGRFGRATPSELRAEAETKLATLQNVQEARVALNDALDGMINDGEVSVSPASADVVARVADLELPKVVNADDEVDAFLAAARRDRVLSGATLTEGGYALKEANNAFILKSLDEAGDLTFQPNGNDLVIGMASVSKRRRGEGIARGLYEEAVALAAKRGGVLRSDVSVSNDAIRVYESLARRGYDVRLNPNATKHKSGMIGNINDPQSNWVYEVRPKPDAENAPSSSIAPSYPSKVNTSSPTAALDSDIQQASARVGRPEAPRELAEQYKVNPETGEFAEQAEIDQLIASGRVSEEDLAMLTEADETIKSANAYGEAVKAFASCAV